jgi:hypothetical protein
MVCLFKYVLECFAKYQKAVAENPANAFGVLA